MNVLRPSANSMLTHTLPCGRPNCRFQFQKRSQHFIGAHNETLSIVALSGFLEGSALEPFVKVGALTRQRFRITRNSSWRTILSGRSIFLNAHLIVLCFRL